MKKIASLVLLVTTLFTHAAEEKQPCDELHTAAEQGDVETMQALIAAGVDKNIKNCSGQTALHRAALCNQVAAIKFLLGLGVPVDQEANGGDTPLCLAAYGTKDAVQCLLAHGADVSKGCRLGVQGPLSPALFRASGWVSDSTIITLLLQAGANPHGYSYNQTCLYFAACQGRTKTCELLLNAGVDINDGTLQGYSDGVDKNKMCGEKTPLIGAAQKNQCAVVELLVERGADPTIQDRQYRGGALWYAVRHGCLRCIRALLSHTKGIKQAEQWSSLDMPAVAAVNEHLDVLSVLHDHGAPMDQPSGKGKLTPLQWAASSLQWQSVDYLLQHAIQKDREDSLGRTALFHALNTNSRSKPYDTETLCKYKRRRRIVLDLIGAGAHIDAKSAEELKARPLYLLPWIYALELYKQYKSNPALPTQHVVSVAPKDRQALHQKAREAFVELLQEKKELSGLVCAAQQARKRGCLRGPLAQRIAYLTAPCEEASQKDE